MVQQKETNDHESDHIIHADNHIFITAKSDDFFSWKRNRLISFFQAKCENSWNDKVDNLPEESIISQ